MELRNHKHIREMLLPKAAQLIEFNIIFKPESILSNHFDRIPQLIEITDFLHTTKWMMFLDRYFEIDFNDTSLIDNYLLKISSSENIQEALSIFINGRNISRFLLKRKSQSSAESLQPFQLGDSAPLMDYYLSRDPNDMQERDYNKGSLLIVIYLRALSHLKNNMLAITTGFRAINHPCWSFFIGRSPVLHIKRLYQLMHQDLPSKGIKNAFCIIDGIVHETMPLESWYDFRSAFDNNQEEVLMQNKAAIYFPRIIDLTDSESDSDENDSNLEISSLITS